MIRELFGVGRHFWAIGMVAFAVNASACRAQPAYPKRAATETFAPAETRSLQAFGAIGDGKADDTAAIQRALANSDHYCLDGGGQTYRVTGTLRADRDLCLRHLTLMQSAVPFDTTPYIRRPCPQTSNAATVVDCGDPAIPAEELAKLRASLSVRTLLIRPGRAGGGLRVILDDIKVDRGRYPEAGSRADAAGIWLQGADRADLRNVEITGYGKGYGLMLLRSRNVTVDGLWIHDLVWAPYQGERPFTEAQVAALGWNSVPIHEFREAGQDGAGSSKFYGVRIQEQITCAVFSQDHNVLIRNPRISRCMAKFRDGELPWQSDGLDIAQASSDVTVDGAVIDSTWNAMDIVANGGGLDRLTINNVRASNSFTYGLKFGYQLRNARITNALITNSGIAGIVIYGPVSGITVSGAEISGVGQIAGNGRTLVPWPALKHSGIRIDEGSAGTEGAGHAPHDITIESVGVSNSPNAPPYQFGILNTGGTGIHVRDFRASDFSNAKAMGVPGLQQP